MTKVAIAFFCWLFIGGSWAFAQDPLCFKDIYAVPEPLASVVAELDQNQLPELIRVLKDSRVEFRILPSERSFEIEWKYSLIRNRYTLTVTGQIQEGERELAIWQTALALSQMRRYQGLFQYGRPLWQTRPLDDSDLDVSHEDLSDKAVEYFLFTYPKLRREALLEDMATMDVALYELYQKLQKTSAVQLPLDNKDSARSPKLSFVAFMIYSFTGAFSNRHQVNVQDLAANFNVTSLKERLRQRFGWRLVTNWHEMHFTRAIIFAAVIMVPIHAYHGRWVPFFLANTNPQELADAINSNEITKERALAEDVLAAIDDTSASEEDRRNALEALDELYKKAPDALKDTRAEQVVRRFRSGS